MEWNRAAYKAILRLLINNVKYSVAELRNMKKNRKKQIVVLMFFKVSRVVTHLSCVIARVIKLFSLIIIHIN